jgi:hypothetical protein
VLIAFGAIASRRHNVAAERFDRRMQNAHVPYHLFFEKAMVLLVALVTFIGGSCCTAFAPPDTVDRSTALLFTAIGLLGTIGMVILLRKLLQRDARWRFFNLRRNLVVFLLCLCWTFGATGGFVVFCLIPRHLV